METESSGADSEGTTLPVALNEVEPEVSSLFMIVVVQFVVVLLTTSYINFLMNTSVSHQKMLLISIIFAVASAWGTKDEKDEFQIGNRDDFVAKLHILLANEGYDPLVSRDNWLVFKSSALLGARRLKVALRGERVIIVGPKPAMKKIKDWLRR